MTCKLKNTNFTFVPLLNETNHGRSQKTHRLDYHTFWNCKKREGVQLDMLVFCNRSKHVTDAARRFTTLLRCCIWSSSASPTLTVWAAAAKAVINALSDVWQQTEAITCSVFPLALTHQTHLIPHLGHIHQQFIEKKMCCLCAHFQWLLLQGLCLPGHHELLYDA